METPQTFPILPLVGKCFPPFVQYGGEAPFLTPEECLKVIALGNAKQMLPGCIGNGDQNAPKLDRGYRSVETCSLWPADALWLFERLRDRVTWSNADFFRFDLTGMPEAIQFLKYEVVEGQPPGHYNWHQDFGGGPSSNRKISAVIQLSDPKDYDGCRLKLFTDQEFEAPTTGQGDMILFPSWTPHCVTNITRGTRYALACWIAGPQFR